MNRKLEKVGECVIFIEWKIMLNKLWKIVMNGMTFFAYKLFGLCNRFFYFPFVPFLTIQSHANQNCMHTYSTYSYIKWKRNKTKKNVSNLYCLFLFATNCTFFRIYLMLYIGFPLCTYKITDSFFHLFSHEL